MNDERLKQEISERFKKVAKAKDEYLVIRQPAHVSSYHKPQGSMFYFSDKNVQKILQTIRVDEMSTIVKVADGFYRVKYNLKSEYLNPNYEEDSEITEIIFQ